MNPFEQFVYFIDLILNLWWIFILPITLILTYAYFSEKQIEKQLRQEWIDRETGYLIAENGCSEETAREIATYLFDGPKKK